MPFAPSSWLVLCCDAFCDLSPGCLLVYRYATFSTKHPIGMGNRMVQVASAHVVLPTAYTLLAILVDMMGNRMVQVASALVLALATGRRLLINWRDPEPLTDYLRPADLDWDYDAFFSRHPRAQTKVEWEREASGGPEVLVSKEQVAAFLDGDGAGGRGAWMVIYSPDKLCPACGLLFDASNSKSGPAAAGGGGHGWRRVVCEWRETLPRDQFFFLLGQVLRALFVLAPNLEREFRVKWRGVGPGGGGTAAGVFSVGVQIRRGLWHVASKGAAGDKGLLSDEGERALLACAKQLVRPDLDQPIP